MNQPFEVNGGVVEKNSLLLFAGGAETGFADITLLGLK